ncbi:MAG TPA: class I SAM-dependent methyltransferase [Thermomicrobiales bacterium]|jgi:2-polyprenyl-3-methyl-5-hydroxy-6-metoxy-1,4-benzoquinol methylase
MQDDLGRVRANYDAEPEREWQRLEGGAQARLEYIVTRHALARHLPAPAPSLQVLDAGGGPGRYTIALAQQGYRMTLLDLSPALLTLAEQRIAATRPEVRHNIAAIIEGSITDLSAFSIGQFDAALCLGGVLSHLPDANDRRRALRELRRVVHTDGLVFISVFNRLAGFRSAVQWPNAWSQFFPRLLHDGRVPMGANAIPTHAFYPEEFEAELTAARLSVRALYGCQGLGAHLHEDHLLALMDDAERWESWRRVLLDTCDHPSIVGVSSHLLAVASPSNAD